MRIQPIAGLLLLAMWVLNLLHLYLGLTAWPAALCAWLAALLLGPGLSPMARRQCLALYLAAGGLSLLAAFLGAPLSAAAYLLPNIDMLTLFAAVSSLSLASGQLSREAGAWRGRRGLWSSMLGLNLLGAVINLSVLFIVGDRLERNGTLERRQVMVMTRLFCAAAFWSPFFVAMAVAVTYAPGMQLGYVMGFGLLAALGAMLLTAREVQRLGVTDFEGYPLRPRTLLLPLGLAGVVLAVKALWPALGIIAVIALAAPLMALLLMPRQGRAPALRRQVVERLPGMGSQLVLFLGAGLLAASLHSLTSVWSPLEYWSLGSQFGLLHAGATLLLILLLSYLGLHPIISIASLAPLLWTLHPDPTLLALCFLMGWGLSTATSPLSGANLALIAR